MSLDGLSLKEIAPPGNNKPVGKTPYADDRPIFVVGAPRSGTTFLRDMLRRVPNFICPEESHFYRWADPLRTPSSFTYHQKNKLLIQHREMDGVPHEAFLQILERSRSKQELMRRYITVFAAAKGIEGPYRWFDKTPQNVYGTPLILQDFPKGGLVHIVRNPLNVIASLTLGRQVKIPDLHGACNYWLESVQIMRTMEQAYPDFVKRIYYEDLTTNVPEVIESILDFAGIEMPQDTWSVEDAYQERDQWKTTFSQKDLTTIVNRCGLTAKWYGYDLKAIVEAQADPAL